MDLKKRFELAFEKEKLVAPDLNAEEFARWIECVDESSFSFEEWISAWCILLKHIAQHQGEMEIKDQLEYLACAAQGLIAAGDAASATLALGVRDFIEWNGVERMLIIKPHS